MPSWNRFSFCRLPYFRSLHVSKQFPHPSVQGDCFKSNSFFLTSTNRYDRGKLKTIPAFLHSASIFQINFHLPCFKKPISPEMDWDSFHIPYFKQPVLNQFHLFSLQRTHLIWDESKQFQHFLNQIACFISISDFLTSNRIYYRK